MTLIQPDIAPVKESGDLYVLLSPYRFEFLNQVFVIPSGFRYDGASYAGLLFQRDGIHRAAALVHDYLYENKGLIGVTVYTRKQADELFKTMLMDAGVKSWHTQIAYLSVRVFGYFYWRD